ncbi:MAG: hypothetical protein AAFV30_11645, partial [Pseudomonadota bacterium]
LVMAERSEVEAGLGDWVVALLPLAACVGLAFVASELLSMLSPGLTVLSPQLVQPSHASPQQAERFGTAALVWIAGGSAVFVALGATLAISLWAVFLVRPYRVFWCVVLVFSAVGAWWAARVPSFSTSLHNQISDLGWTALPIDVLTDRWNGLTAAAVAAMFVASGALIFGVRTGAIEDPHRAARRLKWLLSSGAIALVLGVLTIGSLYRLPATLVEPMAADERTILTQAIDDAVTKADSHLSKEDQASSPASEPSELPIVRRWVASRLDGELPPDVIEGVAEAIEKRLVTEGDQVGFSKQLKKFVLQDASQQSGPEVVRAVESLALHMASFWGVVFTSALFLLYVPTAAVIVTQERRQGGAGNTKPMGLIALDDQKALFQPLLRVIAALSPLLVGALGELFTALQALLANPPT